MVFMVLATVIFAVEMIFKAAVEERVEEGVRKPVLKGKLFLTKFHNRGAFRGFLQERPELLKGISIGVIGVCSVIYILTLGHKGERLMKLGLSFLLGGAFSNAYDRIKRGYVVDYFGFNVKNDKIRNMVFNLSDFFIAIGAAIAAFRA